MKRKYTFVILCSMPTVLTSCATPYSVPESAPKATLILASEIVQASQAAAIYPLLAYESEQCIGKMPSKLVAELKVTSDQKESYVLADGMTEFKLKMFWIAPQPISTVYEVWRGCISHVAFKPQMNAKYKATFVAHGMDCNVKVETWNSISESWQVEVSAHEHTPPICK